MDRSAEQPAKIPLLQTADQYLAWKTRVYDKCWAVTGHDLAETTDEDCKAGLKAAAEVKDMGKRDNWVSICWMIVTGSLHDDLLLKLTTKRGLLASLMTEINAALMINSAEEVQPLRLELYAASMQKDGNSDLQSYIAYLTHRLKKLQSHAAAVPEGEAVAIFIHGLHPIYQPLQVHFALPGVMPKTFDAAVDVVRKYSATPAVAAELAKVKAGAMSQHMFAATPAPSASSKPLCRQFSRYGSCQLGAKCKFSHTSTPSSQTTPQTGQPNSQGHNPQRSMKCAFVCV